MHAVYLIAVLAIITSMDISKLTCAGHTVKGSNMVSGQTEDDLVVKEGQASQSPLNMEGSENATINDQIQKDHAAWFKFITHYQNTHYENTNYQNAIDHIKNHLRSAGYVFEEIKTSSPTSGKIPESTRISTEDNEYYDDETSTTGTKLETTTISAEDEYYDDSDTGACLNKSAGIRGTTLMIISITIITVLIFAYYD